MSKDISRRLLVVVPVLILCLGVVLWGVNRGVVRLGGSSSGRSNVPSRIEPIAKDVPVETAMTPSEEKTDKGSVDTASSKAYSNAQYGFELEAPVKLQDLKTIGSVTVSGKTYKAVQLTNGSDNPMLRVVEGWSDPSKDPYDEKAVSSEIISNGLTWYVFYNPKGGLAQCDSSIFQTALPNGTGTLMLSASNQQKCPGNPARGMSTDFLTSMVSTVRFIK